MKVAHISNRCPSDGFDVVAQFVSTLVIIVFSEVVTLSSNTPLTLFKEKVRNTREIF